MPSRSPDGTSGRRENLDQHKPALERGIDKLREPFWAFISAQTTASGFLLAALVAALLIANSSFAPQFQALQHYPLGLVIGARTVEWSLQHIVNDGLIALFFFLIGLEVKRELLAGELQDRSRVGLLLCAALGGMLAPAGLYLIFNLGMSGGVASGWGIPMATDTAIAIGVLAALAARVPKSAVTFLVGVAIIDDIGAIVVIAVFYTEQLSWRALFFAGLLFSALLLFNRAGARHPAFYALAGVALWAMIVRSGVHASIAGVIVAATVPARPRLAPAALGKEVKSVLSDVSADADPESVLGDASEHERITDIERIAQQATTPLRRWEDSLELPVAVVVLPLFAFLNAGVAINGEALARLLVDPVPLGIVVGLLIGKPVGLLGGVWLCERLGFARMPAGLSRRHLLGVGLLAGVGFTMSTFIAQLALESAGGTLDSAKLAIVVASAIAAAGGYLVLRSAPKTKSGEAPDRPA